MTITYAIYKLDAVIGAEFGLLMVAKTRKGICQVSMGSTEDGLLAELMTDYPGEIYTRHDSALSADISKILDILEGKEDTANIPLTMDLRWGTDFQRQVWNYLKTIPYGETRSYSEVAEAIGYPQAIRACASACASNVMSLLIPCHRVVYKDGSFGEYRWGRFRKQMLLDFERETAKLQDLGNLVPANDQGRISALQAA